MECGKGEGKQNENMKEPDGSVMEGMEGQSKERSILVQGFIMNLGKLKSLVISLLNIAINLCLIGMYIVIYQIRLYQCGIKKQAYNIPIC